jgi:hypothetical protein
MAWVRRLIVMVLGVVLIVDALTEPRFEVVPFAIGVLMVGLVPVDAVIDALAGGGHTDDEVDRLREVMKHKDPDSS